MIGERLELGGTSARPARCRATESHELARSITPEWQKTAHHDFASIGSLLDLWIRRLKFQLS
jgi:hypothetical protein